MAGLVVADGHADHEVRGPVGACYTGRIGVFSSTRSQTIRRYDMAQLIGVDDVEFGAHGCCVRGGVLTGGSPLA